MEKIINLTQHAASAEQLAAGVIDLPAGVRETVIAWLTFDSLPTASDVAQRADLIADAAIGSGYAMIGGAPFLMSALENALIERGITPLYAFSVRASTERAMPDGSVQKVNVFRHLGFVQI